MTRARRPLGSTTPSTRARLVLTFLALGALLPDRASAALTAGITAHRTACYAPCAVHFDGFSATNDSTRDEGAEFLELLYEWDFSDPNSGAWTTSALDPSKHPQSKNEDHGPVVAHVFDPKRTGDGFDRTCASNPGVGCRQYEVSLVVATPEGDVQVDRQLIDVWDPDNPNGLTTFCFTNHPGPTGDCPVGGTEITSVTDFDSAINSHDGPNVQLLFYKDNLFTADAEIEIPPTSTPMRIGRYGTGGADPVVDDNFSSIGMNHSGLLDVDRAIDVVVQQLHFEGPAITDSTGDAHIVSQDEFLRGPASENVMLYRLDLDGYNNLISLGRTGDADSAQHFFLVETDSTNKTDGLEPGADTNLWGDYIDSAFLGNILLGNATPGHAGGGRHTVRIMLAHRVVIGHNTIKNAGGHTGPGSKHLLELRCTQNNQNPLPPTGDGVCRWQHVFHNRFSGFGTRIGMGIHQNDAGNCPFQFSEYILVEGNYFDFDRAGFAHEAIATSQDHIVVRNNACYQSVAPPSGDGNVTCARIYTRGCSGEPGVPSHVKLYNNSLWIGAGTNTAGPWVAASNDYQAGTGNTCDNNLVYAETGASVAACRDNTKVPPQDLSGPGSLVSTSTNPFVSAGPPRYLDDFRLAPGSAASDAGTDLDEVAMDAGGACRIPSLGVNSAAGAWEDEAQASACAATLPSRPAAPILLDP